MNITFPDLPEDPIELEELLREEEQGTSDVKPGADARILWADPDRKRQTPVSLVYLHGFTASQGEGYPVHEQLARRYGLNLYLARLSGHGLENPDAFSGLTPQALLDSAAKAFSIGQRIGNEVIMMGTSTGASLALYLASVIENRNLLRGLILYSPLIDFHGINSLLLTHRWSRKILKLVPGKEFYLRSKAKSPEIADIWYTRYLLEGTLALGKLIEETMTHYTFSKITHPVFTGYYFKNRMEKDKVVSVAKILNMHDQLSTEKGEKRIINFPNAGSHVICSSLLSGSVYDVKEETFRFTEEILGLKPV